MQNDSFGPACETILFNFINKTKPHIYLYEEEREARTIRYGELLSGASAVSLGLRERGLQSGQTVAIMLPTGEDFFLAFFGVLLAGGIPVPIYPPQREYFGEKP